MCEGEKLVREAVRHVFDGGKPLCDHVLLGVEGVFAAGDAPFRHGDLDTDAGGVGGAVSDVVLVGGVIQEGGDELQRVVVAVPGTEIAQQAVCYRMIIVKIRYY